MIISTQYSSFHWTRNYEINGWKTSIYINMLEYGTSTTSVLKKTISDYRIFTRNYTKWFYCLTLVSSKMHQIITTLVTSKCDLHV